MRVIHGSRRLVEVLTEWGLHEAEGRLRGKLPAPLVSPVATGPARDAAGVELALRYRSPLVGRILQAGPLAVLSVEFDPDDRAGLFIADGRPLPQWADAISKEETADGKYVLDLAGGSDPVTHQLVCAVHAPGADLNNIKAPIVIYDGWHRGAAWWLQMEAGRRHMMSGDLILTENLDPALAVVPREGT
jgi:hypothetical protein